MFKQQISRIQHPQAESPIYEPHSIQHAIPIEVNYEINRLQQNGYYKINSSNKKTNKISLYSKKSMNSVQKIKSPKKNEHLRSTNYEILQTKTNAFTNIRNLGDNLLGQMNNMIENNLKTALPNIMTKITKKNTTPINNIIMNQQSYNNQPIITEKKICPKYNFEYTNQQISRLNPNNISQMIDKEVESELNSCGTIYGTTEKQTSFFLTGRSKDSYHQKQNIIITNTNINTNNINKESETQISTQALQNVYKCMRQQILLAKQNYQKKFLDSLKENAQKIKQLESKIQKNSIKIKEKNTIIQKMSQKFIAITSKQRSLTMGTSHNISTQETHKYEHILNRVKDIETKLKIIEKSSLGSSKTHNTVLIKIQILQKQVINYLSSKLTTVKNELNHFAHRFGQKILKIQKANIEIVQKIKQEMLNLRNGIILDKNNENKFKDIINKFKFIELESKSFMSRQFKYHNVGVQELKQKFENLKQKIRSIESQQFQNNKLTKQLSSDFQAITKKQSTGSNINTTIPNPSSPLQTAYYIKNLDVSGIHETKSKYSRNNPNNPNLFNFSNYSNMSSFDQLSQTNEYSYLVEKLNANEKNLPKCYLKEREIKENEKSGNMNLKTIPPINNESKDESSIISMNFTQQLEVQETQSLIYNTKARPNDDKDLKNTNAQLYTPNSTKKSIISNLVHHNQKNSKFNNSHNNSYLSIGQMQDYHQNLNINESPKLTDLKSKHYLNIVEPSQRIYNKQINDEDDDEFFYYQGHSQNINHQKSHKQRISNNKQLQSQKQSQYIEQPQQLFLPIKQKIFSSTESNFYNKNRIVQNNKMNFNNDFYTSELNQRINIKKENYPDISHSSASFDYQTFVQSDEENQKNNHPVNLKMMKNNKHN